MTLALISCLILIFPSFSSFSTIIKVKLAGLGNGRVKIIAVIQRSASSFEINLAIFWRNEGKSRMCAYEVCKLVDLLLAFYHLWNFRVYHVFAPLWKHPVCQSWESARRCHWVGRPTFSSAIFCLSLATFCSLRLPTPPHLAASHSRRRSTHRSIDRRKFLLNRGCAMPL